jgi:hypothetical protein
MKNLKNYTFLFAISIVIFSCEQKKQSKIDVAKITTTSFVLENPPKIGTWNDFTFFEGGFSGLYYIPDTEYEFFMINDRGPNFPISDTTLTGGKEVKLFPFPNYTQKLVHVKAIDGKLQILSIRPLIFNSGEKLTGIPIPTELKTHEEIAWSNLDKEQIPPAMFGADIEGLTIQNDSILWFCEEYRPSIWKINLNRMSVEKIYSYDDKSLPEILAKRRPNRGFEGITYANGKIYAMMQSPLRNPDKSIENLSRLNRIIELDVLTGEVHTFVYEMNDIQGRVGIKDWKIGDITHYDENRLLILEHAQKDDEQYIEIYLINLSEASRLNVTHPVHENLEIFLTAENLLIQEKIKPVSKKLVIDLIAEGFDTNLGKPEGLSLISQNIIAVLNDNDYEIEEPGQSSLLKLVNRPTKIYFFQLPDNL